MKARERPLGIAIIYLQGSGDAFRLIDTALPKLSKSECLVERTSLTNALGFEIMPVAIAASGGDCCLAL
jgi:hypothetical protein